MSCVREITHSPAKQLHLDRIQVCALPDRRDLAQNIQASQRGVDEEQTELHQALDRLIEHGKVRSRRVHRAVRPKGIEEPFQVFGREGSGDVEVHREAG